MALEELKTSRTHSYLKNNREEWTREYYCSFAEADLVSPRPGELMPGTTDIFCTSTVISPFGTDQAKVVVAYSSLSGSTQEIDQVEESLDITCETATEVVDAAGNAVGGAAMPIMQPMALYRLSVTRRELNLMSILTIVGKVNSSTWRGAEPGTMLFMGATARRQGEGKWKMEYVFQYNNDDRHKSDIGGQPCPKGWNNPVDKTGWRRYMYGLRDFALLGLED